MLSSLIFDKCLVWYSRASYFSAHFFLGQPLNNFQWCHSGAFEFSLLGHRRTVWFFVWCRLLDFITDQSKFIYFLIELFFKLSYLAEDKNLCTKTNFFRQMIFISIYWHHQMGGQVIVALGIGLYFFVFLKPFSYWFEFVNRGRAFLQELTKNLRVGRVNLPITENSVHFGPLVESLSA